MKLAPESTLNGLLSLKKRYVGFQSRFKEFSDTLAWFDGAACSLKGVEHSLSDDGRTETVSFEGATIAFRLTRLVSSADGGTRILVICTLENPIVGEDKPQLGSFTFDQTGRTDFEVVDTMDTPDIQESAPDIVAHFLLLALRRPPI